MPTIGIYKTDVADQRRSGMIMSTIRRLVLDYDVSSDLEDWDNILRAENVAEGIEEAKIKNNPTILRASNRNIVIGKPWRFWKTPRFEYGFNLKEK